MCSLVLRKSTHNLSTLWLQVVEKSIYVLTYFYCSLPALWGSFQGNGSAPPKLSLLFPLIPSFSLLSILCLSCPASPLSCLPVSLDMPTQSQTHQGNFVETLCKLWHSCIIKKYLYIFFLYFSHLKNYSFYGYVYLLNMYKTIDQLLWYMMQF